MRLLLASLALLIPANPAEKTYETYAFLAKWQPHTMDMGHGDVHWTYSTTWEIEVPAPSEKPAYADIRAMTAFVYKHIALNASPQENEVEFLDRTFLTSVTLEGVELAVASTTLPNIGAALGCSYMNLCR